MLQLLDKMGILLPCSGGDGELHRMGWMYTEQEYGVLIPAHATGCHH